MKKILVLLSVLLMICGCSSKQGEPTIDDYIEIENDEVISKNEDLNNYSHNEMLEFEIKQDYLKYRNAKEGGYKLEVRGGESFDYTDEISEGIEIYGIWYSLFEEDEDFKNLQNKTNKEDLVKITIPSEIDGQPVVSVSEINLNVMFDYYVEIPDTVEACFCVGHIGPNSRVKWIGGPSTVIEEIPKDLCYLCGDIYFVQDDVDIDLSNFLSYKNAKISKFDGHVLNGSYESYIPLKNLNIKDRGNDGRCTFDVIYAENINFNADYIDARWIYDVCNLSIGDDAFYSITLKGSTLQCNELSVGRDSRGSVHHDLVYSENMDIEKQYFKTFKTASIVDFDGTDGWIYGVIDVYSNDTKIINTSGEEIFKVNGKYEATPRLDFGDIYIDVTLE